MNTAPHMDLKVVAHNRHYRAVPLAQLQTWARQGRLAPTDLVRPAGSEMWIAIAEVPAIAAKIPGAATGSPQPARPQRPPAAPTTGRSPASAAASPSPGAAAADSDEIAETIDFDEVGSVAWSDDWPKQELEEPSLDMLPMIDVIFQLLIFFMFTNQLANPNPVETPAAVYGVGVTPDGKQMILVDDQGNYFLGDSTRDEMRIGSVEEVTRRVAENAAAAPEGSLPVIINAHKLAKHRQVRLLVEALSAMDEVPSIKVGVEEQQ